MVEIAIKYIIWFLFMVIRIYATDVGGSISANTVWTKSESPYYLRGSIIIEKSVKLEIEPGVVINCYDRDSLYNGGYSIIVEGILRAIGTVDDSIIFDSYPDHVMAGPNWPEWGGIRIYDSTYTDSSIFQYCHVKRSNYGIKCFNSAPRIIHCHIKSGNEGISLIGVSSSTAELSYNLIEGNTGGLRIYDTSPLVTYNIIRCTGPGNSVACLKNSGPEFHYNDIYGPFTSSGDSINAENNYWGTSDGDSILIIHYFDDLVDYNPFLTTKTGQ